jgi:hypothetical protein
MKIINFLKMLVSILFCFFIFGCSTLYYGYLNGDEYPIYKNTDQIDLNRKEFHIEIVDSRLGQSAVECAPHEIDRNTELEGHRGIQLLKEYIEQSIMNANGQISESSSNIVHIELMAISFNLSGFVDISSTGVSQILVKYKKKTKSYCSQVSDKDKNSPLKWYSVETRKNISRKISSFAMRVNIDKLLQDLK